MAIEVLGSHLSSSPEVKKRMEREAQAISALHHPAFVTGATSAPRTALITVHLSADTKIVAVPVTTGANFNARTPTALVQASPREMVATSEQFSHDVSKGRQKFLINTQPGTTITPTSVVLHWAARPSQ